MGVRGVLKAPKERNQIFDVLKSEVKRIPPLQGLGSWVVLLFTGLCPVLLRAPFQGLWCTVSKFFIYFDILSGYTMCY